MDDSQGNTNEAHPRAGLFNTESVGQTLSIEDIRKHACVITVHGTFARGAKWAQQDSTLSRSIVQWFAERDITASIVPFTWSGKNLIEARRSAADDLLELIDRIRIDSPQSAIFIVAHSHGGSVVAYALKKRPELARLITGFVALATPWVGITPCNYAVELRLLIVKSITYVLFFAGTLILFPIIVDLLLAVKFPETIPASYGGPGWMYYVDKYLHRLFISISMFAVAGSLFAVFQRYLSRKLARGASLFHEKLVVFADRVNTLRDLFPSSVFIKSVGDEAALALTWTSAMAVLMQWASTILFLFLQGLRSFWLRIPAWIRVPGGLLLMAVWSVETFMFMEFILEERITGIDFLTRLSAAVKLDMNGVVYDLAVLIAALLWILAFLIVVPLILAMAVAFLAAMGFGSLSLRTALFFKLSAESVPVGRHEVVLLEESTEQSELSSVRWNGLRHSSLYEEPDAIRAILNAFSSFCRR